MNWSDQAMIKVVTANMDGTLLSKNREISWSI